jgi:hypothetical protein
VKLPQLDESFLKALLHNVFRVRSVASESQDNAQHSSVITTDQHFKRLISPAFGGSNQRHVIFSQHNRKSSDRRCFFVQSVYEFSAHDIPPSHS